MRNASVASRLLQRSFQAELGGNRKSFSKHFATREFEEIKFNVPWGHISGKWYGPKNTRPIVGLHGWQDNAGTFDRIASLLPPHVGFLAVDLPGHGLSSWLPDGCTYHSIDYVTFVLTLMREFNWSKISMLCHSMSSMNGFVFCSLFPDKCDMFIGIDILKPMVRSLDKAVRTITAEVELFHKIDGIIRCKSEPPCYDFDQMVDRLYEISNRSIDKNCCQFILKRNVQPSVKEPHKYYFSRDSRLKAITFYALSQDVCLDMARRITCPYLFIKALQGPYYEDKANHDEAVSVLKQKPTFEYHELEGKHHMHLNEPEKIADVINPFIMKHRPE